MLPDKVKRCDVLKPESIDDEEDKDDEEDIGDESNSNCHRWGRDDDRRLFGAIRQLENEGVITYKELMNMPLQIAFSSKEVIQLAQSIGWKTLNRQLLTRIRKLSKRDFSAREIKQLKSIIRHDDNHKDLNYENIIYHFPGKSLKRLKEVSKQIVRGKENKTL